jgi:hypothetical protein
LADPPAPKNETGRLDCYNPQLPLHSLDQKNSNKTKKEKRKKFFFKKEYFFPFNISFHIDLRPRFFFLFIFLPTHLFLDATAVTLGHEPLATSATAKKVFYFIKHLFFSSTHSDNAY